MANLYVPYHNSSLVSEYTEDYVAKYLLYSIYIDKNTSLPTWGMLVDYSEPIADKFKGLQKYFEKRYYARLYPAEFQMESRNLFSPKDKSHMKRPINIERLDQRTPSVFLGIFLKAAEQIQRQEFREDWDVICATGDIDYNEKDGSLRLVSVDHIEEKYESEFKTEADKNKEKKYLFLYISDDEDVKKRVPEGKNGNITVKCYSPGDTLKEVMKFLFKPFDFEYTFNPDKFEDGQIKFLDNMKNINGKEANFGYIPGEGFEAFENSILNDPDWHGFFIHSEGGAGKSATAMAIARYLVWSGKIYAPVWFRINNEKIIKIIEEEDKREFNDIREWTRDKMEEYITAGIAAQAGQSINDLEKSGKKYLVVIDNFELPDTILRRIMKTIQKIFPNRASGPYLIITSRNKYGDSADVDGLNLREEKPPKLTETQAAGFIKTIAGKKGSEYSKKIKCAEENNTFQKLAENLFKRFGDIPELIITSMGLLRYKSVVELTNEIGTSLGSGEASIREKRIEIYGKAFSYLEKAEKQLLYLFVEMGDDNPFSLDDIRKKIEEAEHWEKTPVTKQELTKILRVLLDNNLIYTMEREGKTLYRIKSVLYHTILFEDEFLGPLEESGEYLRDIFVDLDIQLQKALENDQGREIVEPLLKKMKAKNREITKERLCDAIAYSHSSCHEILSLLIDDYNCDINAPDGNIYNYALYGNNIGALEWLYKRVPESLTFKDNRSGVKEDGSTVFHYAAYNNSNTAVLDWFYEHAPQLLTCKTAVGATVFNHAVTRNNTDALDWFYEHAPELLTCKVIDGTTVFHWAACSNNTAVLDWFYEHAPQLLTCKNNFGRTVFHYVAQYSNNTDILDWFYSHAPELLTCKADDGSTVFHYAAQYSNNTAVLDWFYNHAPELLACKDNDDQTVFHYAAENKKTAVLEWLYNHVPDLLICKSDDGTTVFHYAASNSNNTAVLDWFYGHVPELLTCKAIDGRTVFHCAAEDTNTAVLEWLYNHAPELLPCKAIDGRTVFHSAAGKANIAVLDWLYDRVPELLPCKTNDAGLTVFHYATKNTNIAVLEWLYDHVPELLPCKTNDGLTIFHFVTENTNPAILDWFNNHAPELLSCKENDGATVFHQAALDSSNTAILDWFYEHIPELLPCKEDDGSTVFHWAAENTNIAVLEWFYKHIPELLHCKDNNGKTAFHHAKEKDNTAVLDWLSKNAPELCRSEQV